MVGGGDRYWTAELSWWQGEILLANVAADQAAAGHFQHAIETARRLGARILALRAATGLARMWQKQGRAIEAQKSLGALPDELDEGLDVNDFQDAVAPMATLGVGQGVS